MKLIEKYLNEFDSTEFYKKEIEKLTIDDKRSLEELLLRLEKAGAKKPLSWAFSEITENIPQFGRFLFLKGLTNIVHNVKENMSFADDTDENYEENIFKVSEKLEKLIGKAELNNFLKSFTKGVMWQVVNLIDEGNYNTNGEPNWSLKELDKNNKTERNINGLHEDLIGFEDELDISLLEAIKRF